METTYTKIEFGPGESIDSAITRLQKSQHLVCGSFNGQVLYSNLDDIDSAYKKITGKTKKEFDSQMKAEHDQYLVEERKHKESIPQLTKEWIEKGNTILAEKYHNDWAQCVPARLNDLYHGMELGACLEIIKKLNDGCSLPNAKEIIFGQNHSGMSFGLVCLLVKSFCDRGSEFATYVRE